MSLRSPFCSPCSFEERLHDLQTRQFSAWIRLFWQDPHQPTPWYRSANADPSSNRLPSGWLNVKDRYRAPANRSEPSDSTVRARPTLPREAQHLKRPFSLSEARLLERGIE